MATYPFRTLNSLRSKSNQVRSKECNRLSLIHLILLQINSRRTLRTPSAQNHLASSLPSIRISRWQMDRFSRFQSSKVTRAAFWRPKWYFLRTLRLKDKIARVSLLSLISSNIPKDSISLQLSKMTKLRGDSTNLLPIWWMASNLIGMNRGPYILIESHLKRGRRLIF